MIKTRPFRALPHPSVLSRIHLICDELSDSDKGVGKFKFSLSPEDYGLMEAKQS